MPASSARARHWYVFGTLATLLPLANVFAMTLKRRGAVSTRSVTAVAPVGETGARAQECPALAR
jgi:hypothetical protein